VTIEDDIDMPMKKWCVVQLLNAENVAAIEAFEECL
jgi:hypothetical protein